MLKRIHPLALASIATTVALRIASELASYEFGQGRYAIALNLMTAVSIVSAFLPNKKPE